MSSAIERKKLCGGGMPTPILWQNFKINTFDVALWPRHNKSVPFLKQASTFGPVKNAN
jgi:hypothetical protein